MIVVHPCTYHTSTYTFQSQITHGNLCGIQPKLHAFVFLSTHTRYRRPSEKGDFPNWVPLMSTCSLLVIVHVSNLYQVVLRSGRFLYRTRRFPPVELCNYL